MKYQDLVSRRMKVQELALVLEVAFRTGKAALEYTDVLLTRLESSSAKSNYDALLLPRGFPLPINGLLDQVSANMESARLLINSIKAQLVIDSMSAKDV